MELVQKLLLFKKPLQTTARGKQDLEIIGRKIIVRTKSKIIDPHLISSFYSDGGGLLHAAADVISLLDKWASQLRYQAVIKSRSSGLG